MCAKVFSFLSFRLFLTPFSLQFYCSHVYDEMVCNVRQSLPPHSLFFFFLCLALIFCCNASNLAMCCQGVMRVLQYVAVYCSVLQCAASCFSMQRAAVCCSVLQCLQCVAACCSVLQRVAVCCSVLQCIAACCCILLWCVAVCCSVLQCAAVCCSVLQCVAVCCSVLQCVAVCCSVCHTRRESFV